MGEFIWRTVLFGVPVTRAQTAVRTLICIALAIILFAATNAGTILDAVFIFLLLIVAGTWLGKLEYHQFDAKPAPDTQPAKPDPMLDGTVDYKVNTGEPVWITVGNTSIRLVQNADRTASVQAWYLDHEDEPPIRKFDL